MTRSRFAGKAAALATGIWLLAAAAPVGAIDVELPGERRLEIHGFYELRLRAFGEDLPANGMTLSQFRHVLNVETEGALFPEGVGPFDFVFLYTRWGVSYECVYERACGLFKSADVYGGSKRRAKRYPQHFKQGKTRESFAGGVQFVPLVAGTLIPAAGQHIGPGRRYRNCDNPESVFWNPSPLAGFCNFNSDSQLDGPIDLFLEVNARTRAGVVNPRVAKNLLIAARPTLGEERFAELDAIRLLGERDIIDSISGNQIGKDFGFGELNGMARAARSVAALDPSRAGEMHTFLKNLVSRDGVPYAETLNGLGFDPNDPSTVLAQDGFQELLRQRPDKERFGPLSALNGFDLTTSLWAVSQFHESQAIWTSDIDLPIRPDGFFRLPVADTVHELALGMEEPVDNATDEPDPVTGSNPAANELAGKPLFIGPDGVKATADDLPIQMCPPGTTPETLDFGDGQGQVRFAGSRCRDNFPDGTPDLNGFLREPLYYLAGDPSTPNTQLLDLSGLSPTEATAACRAVVEIEDGGLNMNGECILLSTDQRVGRFNRSLGSGQSETIAAKEFLQDPAFRPASAILEPTDLTDLRLRASGAFIPARPPAPGGGTFFTTAGLRKLQQSAHGLISGLDVDFTEDELRWEHGPSADEHEFKEGYLEFSFMDNQVFTRVGKLIMVWGKTELFRNQDRLNPTDSGFGTLSRLEDSRIGQWAVQMTISPAWAMKLGPLEDLRLELAVIFDDFEPTDVGKCGESLTFDQACALTFGALNPGLTGLGLVGAVRPDQNEGGFKQFDYGIRLEGHLDRYTFSISDFWGWDDAPYTTVVHQYGRRVDPETGAPLNAFGPLTCTHRVDPNTGARIGPDGDASTLTDNDMPTVGNCLLWDNPGPFDPNADPNPNKSAPADGLARQFVRASDEIAFNHAANQTLFHTICSISFDEDSGQCSVDFLNDPILFQPVSNILSGETGISGAAVEGYDSVRLISDDPNEPGITPAEERKRLQRPYEDLGRSVFTTAIFAPANSFGGGGNFFSAQLSSEQLALLGCGSAFATSCDSGESLDIRSETPSAFLQALQVDDRIRLVGGVDFLNGNASVLMQESTLLRVNQAGAPVGIRGGETFLGFEPLRFEAGITTLGITVADAAAAGVEATLEVRNLFLASQNSNNEPDCLARGLSGDCKQSVAGFQALIDVALGVNKGALRTELNESATDFQIEPSRWIVDQTKPNLAFLNPLDPGPDGIFDNADDLGIGPDGLAGTSDDDYFDPVLNPNGTVNPLGENCSPFFGGPEPGCTNIEMVAANIERLLIATDIIGGDRTFDPPETLAEMLSMLDGDDQNDPFSDPISGEDGLLFNDFDRDEDLVAEGKPGLEGDGVILHDRLNVDQRATVAIRGLAADSFDDCAANAPSTANFCSLNLDKTRPLFGTLANIEDEVRREEGPRLIGALPIAMRLSVGRQDVTFQIDGLCPSGDTPLEGFRDNPGSCEPRRLVPIQRLSPFELQQLETFDEVTVEGSKIGEPPGPVTLFRTFIDRRLPRQILTELGSLLKIDQDGGGARATNRVFDLDQDRDGALDFVDDGLPGPVSDDNILCGSGIPGDVLQDAQQTDFDGVEQKEFDRSGIDLPARSPVFCGGLAGVINATGQTLPFVRSGGDGRFGRRDFLWHGGRQLAFRYQRKNVFGMAIDFAEDRTKTSWGIEFSWMSKRLFGNSLEFDGLSRSSELVLSVSIDRPTFFHFLNPNRSFFLNLQFFMRYLTNYKGGSDDRDGLYGTAPSAFSFGTVLVTAFTGYFQDRLSPRVTFAWDPHTSTYALLSGIGYRFNDVFSTAFSLNHFFGHYFDGRTGHFPPVLLGGIGAIDLTSESPGRGFGGARNRDVASLIVRYTF